MDQELEALEKALGDATGQGVEGAEDIQAAVSDFRSSETPSPEEHEGLIERLRHGAERLEASHPDLSAALARAIDALTAWGL